MECPKEFYRWAGELGYSDCRAREESGEIIIETGSSTFCVGKRSQCVNVEGGQVSYRGLVVRGDFSEWEIAGAIYGLRLKGIERPQIYLFHFLEEVMGLDERLNLNLPFKHPFALVHLTHKGFEHKGVEALAVRGIEALKKVGYPYGFVTNLSEAILRAGSHGKIKLTASGLYGDALVYKGTVTVFAMRLGDLERKVRGIEL